VNPQKQGAYGLFLRHSQNGIRKFFQNKIKYLSGFAARNPSLGFVIAIHLAIQNAIHASFKREAKRYVYKEAR
jgi:succinate dehydrogenase/fumarate reductase cytochrome b subunit